MKKIIKHQLTFLFQHITLIAHHLNLIKIIEQNSARELDEFDYEFYLNTTKDINIEDKSKYFLSYLRNCGRDIESRFSFLFSMIYGIKIT